MVRVNRSGYCQATDGILKMGNVGEFHEEMMFTDVGRLQGSYRGPWMGEASPPQPDGTKAVGSSDWNPRGEHQVEKETGAAAGHTGQSPGHGARRGVESHLTSSHEYRHSLCM